MTPEKQRIKIAEALGWEVIEYTLCNVRPDKNGDPEIEPIAPLPDYLNDLNAMHEAEKTLREMQTIAFIDRLGEIVDQGGIVGSYGEIWNMLSATATQRAEAFLKTINLWES